MYDVPVHDALTLIDVRASRQAEQADRKAKQPGGPLNLQSFHERMRANQRRGAH